MCVGLLPVSAVAQVSAQSGDPILPLPKSIRFSQSAEVAPVATTAPAQVVKQEVKPVDVTPELIPASAVLEEGTNQDQVLAETYFKSSFGEVAKPGQTLEKLLSDAYENNPEINAARDALRAADEQVYQANSSYLPTVDFTYGKNYDDNSYNGGASNAYYTDSKVLSLNQSLFSGGKLHYGKKSVENKIFAARNELKNAEQNFLIKSINAYINYIFSKKVLVLANNNEKVLQEQLRASQERLNVGDATNTDVAQSQARLANATSSRVIAEGDFVKAKADFVKVFGVEAEENIPMPDRLPDIPATLDQSIKIGLNNNPQILQLGYLVKSRDNDIGVQSSALLPQVDMTGAISDVESPTNFGLVTTESNSLGVNVTVPLYDAGVAWSKTRAARDVRNQTQKQYNNAINELKSAITQSWQQILTTSSNIESTKSGLTASELALKGVRLEQQEGARTIIDLLDAEQEKFTAETNHARAIKDSVLAIYNLKATLGELTPEQLGLSATQYDPEEHYKNTRFKFIGL